jgi:4-alpha-glucanotransferase
MPIFVAYDSVDVWAHPEQFKLDENLNPTVVTGVPPDYFSETGQRWGNPHYNWPAMQVDDFSWWRKRVEAALEMFDLVRIDHFRGLEASWEIDASEPTAINGRWVKAPGAQLLSRLQQEFDPLPLVAEDLGIITPEVVALKQQFNLPGMSVLQFGFSGLPDNPHSPHELVENSVVYTGTHDNDTTLGWFNGLNADTQNWILSQVTQDAGEMPWPLIVTALRSVANRVVVPMQDWLSLGSEHRMNIPGTTQNNWHWQFDWDEVPDGLEQRIFKWVKVTNRLNPIQRALAE